MRIIRRSALSILLFGILLWKLCGMSAAAETTYEVRFEQIVIAETVHYQNEAGDEIKTVQDAEESFSQSAKILIDMVWSGKPGKTLGGVKQEDGSWVFDIDDASILDTHNLEQVTVRVMDNGQEYRTVLSGDALPIAKGQQLLFDKLVLEVPKTVRVETGALEVTADFQSLDDPSMGLDDVPAGYTITIQPEQDISWFGERQLTASFDGSSHFSWKLENVPVGIYTVMQKSYAYDSYTAIPSVSGTGEKQPDGSFVVQSLQGKSAVVHFINLYADGGLEGLALDGQMDMVKEQDHITVTCRIGVRQYIPALFPSIQAYLQSEDGGTKLSPSSRIEGAVPPEPAVTFKFTLDETAAGSTWQLILSGAPSSGDMKAAIPDFVSPTITIEVQHHYGGGTVPHETVVKDAPVMLEDQWIKEQGMDTNTYPASRKRASHWQLFDESGQIEIKVGDIHNSSFSSSDILFEPGKTYQLQIHYDTLYTVIPYWETAAGTPGAEMMGDQYYSAQQTRQSYQSCAQAFDLNAEVQEFEGFHFCSADTDGQLAGGKILDDGSTRIKVYYDKNEAESSEVSSSGESQETTGTNGWRSSAASFDTPDSHAEASEVSHETVSEAVPENDAAPLKLPPQQSETPDRDLSIAAPPKTKGTVYRIAAVLAIGILFLIILQRRKDD